MAVTKKSTSSTKKKWFIRKLMTKQAWSWRFLTSSTTSTGATPGIFRWKRLNFKISFFNDFLFKIISVFEAVYLVSTLCFFYCFCGCHF